MADLPVVSGAATPSPVVAAAPAAVPEPPPPAPEPAAPPPAPVMRAPVEIPTPPQPVAHGTASMDDILSKIERLADLRQKGILTDEEFAAKKAELLGRL